MRAVIIFLVFLFLSFPAYAYEYMKDCEPCHVKLMGPDGDVHTIHTGKKTQMECYGCHGSTFKKGSKIVRLSRYCDFCHVRSYGRTYTTYAHADAMCIYCHAPENNSNISYPVKNLVVFHDVHLLRGEGINCKMCHIDEDFFKKKPTHCYCCHGTNVHKIHNVTTDKITNKCSPCHDFKKHEVKIPEVKEVSIKTKIKLSLMDFLNEILKTLYEMIF
ncbi:MAG: hypothetical protein DRN95_01365 [Candidatus Hydrothermarchaeota archaeon]|nr:MAG: hypothetical protein DRN95_01365 [Candidatus Hydrothermarchaeota archaeon]